MPDSKKVKLWAFAVFAVGLAKVAYDAVCVLNGTVDASRDLPFVLGIILAACGVGLWFSNLKLDQRDKRLAITEDMLSRWPVPRDRASSDSALD